MESMRDPDFVKDIIENICDKIRINENKHIPPDKVWIDSPKTPKFKEASECMVRSIGSPNNYILLREVFPTDDSGPSFL